MLGATYTPDCARIQPARLVRGLARAVEGRGGRIVEATTATDLGPRRVATDRGVVTARTVVRATEAWSAHLAPRSVVPVYSLIVATRPMPSAFWDAAGLAGGQTFTDHRHLIVYGQRTADDRLVFGGRGAPYHWRSRIAPASTATSRCSRACVPRPATCSRPWALPTSPTPGAVRWASRATGTRASGCADGLAWAGGYVGDGVGTSHLAGRTIAALVLGRDDPVTSLPWVGHRSRRWEPEPLRWLLVNAGLRLMTAADTEERFTGRPSVIAARLSRALGG